MSARTCLSDCYTARRQTEGTGKYMDTQCWLGPSNSYMENATPTARKTQVNRTHDGERLIGPLLDKQSVAT